MVARRFRVSYKDDEFAVDYDTDDGLEVLKFQIYSLASVPPDDQKIMAEDDDRAISESSDLGIISEKLRVVSLIGEREGSSRPAEDFEKSDEELARMLQAEEEALLLQEFQASENKDAFEGRIRPYVSQVLMYEDPARQEAARRSVPIDEIEEKALVALAKEGNFKPLKAEVDHYFLLQLLAWFKQSFRWVNSPPCDDCGSGTGNIGMGTALPSEAKYGGFRVELYKCNCCLRITRFPRYNDPLKLLESRKGRCGEWANCFTLYCRAFGYESRLILDFTDHVWTECFSNFLGRWMHLDPCEGVYDNPLLYEKGWKKSLNYVIAIAKDGVYDVTKRYTRKWHQVLSRRNLTTEDVASAVLSSITNACRRRYSFEELRALENRDCKEAEELEKEVHLLVDASVSLPGRRSGAPEWRMARSELGTTDSLSASACPVRLCVDSHVKSIYNALSLFICQAMDNELSKTETLQILKILKGMLENLRASPFKTRRSFLSLKGMQSTKKMMPWIEELLSAISLKGELDDTDRVRVLLACDPVQTSISLPVASDAVDEIIDNLNAVTEMKKNIFQFPKFNRLFSGSVLASGEELPFGIATSAFDGIRMSKWEEPNGAKGCWLLYQLDNDQMHDLDSYDLTSANDAPERDPMNWIVEASKDEGQNWDILDEQSSQIFEKRFQRKSFQVQSEHKYNLFRFRFLAVRDPEATSRFQIGSIDLYARGS
ncbi:putative peptide-N(4)-(N-acetyl-beta-glucosaminyl)asparagine amidase [Dioscorea sansibarensis]